MAFLLAQARLNGTFGPPLNSHATSPPRPGPPALAARPLSLTTIHRLWTSERQDSDASVDTNPGLWTHRQQLVVARYPRCIDGVSTQTLSCATLQLLCVYTRDGLCAHAHITVRSISTHSQW